MINQCVSKKREIIDALGRPLRDLRISVTDRCNFNCTYCMPDKNTVFLPKSQILSFEEITMVVSILRDFGVKKIKITGGEPTLRLGLDTLIRQLTNIQGIEDIGLITNGAFLKVLGERLYNAGLRRINISLDALDARVFQAIVGNTHSIHPVLEGIDHAKAIGFSPIKINCVIQKGINEDQVLSMVEYFKQRNMHLRFIEFMDVGDIAWDGSKVVSSQLLLERIQKQYTLHPITPAYRGEVATRYRHVDCDSEIGFINSVSNPFCRDCNRLRLTADGSLYGCLFSTQGKNIKEYLRRPGGCSEHDLREQLKNFWLQRNDRYSETRLKEHHAGRKKSMHVMGG